jgi:uncharacterized protein YkwD
MPRLQRDVRLGSADEFSVERGSAGGAAVNHEARPGVFTRCGVLLAMVAVLVLAACAVPTPRRLSFTAPILSRAQLAGLVLVNEFRASYGVGPLVPVGELDVKAQTQAQRMADAGQLFHSIDLAAGVSDGWRSIGENIAFAPDISTAEKWLEQSPPHRANLLNPTFSQVGLGIVVRGSVVYVVQDFVAR